jgi:hypothetical protein
VPLGPRGGRVHCGSAAAIGEDGLLKSEEREHGPLACIDDFARFGFKVYTCSGGKTSVCLSSSPNMYSVLVAGKPCSPGPADIVFPGDRADEPEDAQ